MNASAHACGLVSPWKTSSPSCRLTSKTGTRTVSVADSTNRKPPQAHREEVISELAAHLEEDFYDARSRGLTDTEAFAGGDVVLLANGWPVCQFFGAVGAYLSQRAQTPSECG